MTDPLEAPSSLATKIQRGPAQEDLMPVDQRSQVRPDGIKGIEARWFSSTSSPTPDAQQQPGAKQPPTELQQQPHGDQQSKESIPKLKISLIDRLTSNICKTQPLPMTKWSPS